MVRATQFFIFSSFPSVILIMPSAIPTDRERITKFTNCRLVKGDELVEEDLWVSSKTGKIVRSQEVFYTQHAVPDATVNLGGRIISPGLIDVQLNGAFGFDFSAIPDDPSSYGKAIRLVNRSLIRTGVTSYLPTLTSQRKDLYRVVWCLLYVLQDKLLTTPGFTTSGAVWTFATGRRWGGIVRGAL